MPRQRQFYDPQVDDGSPRETLLRGFQVQIGGTYVLLDDVITVLHMFAEAQEHQDDRAMVHEAANWLGSAQSLPDPPERDSYGRTPDHPDYGSTGIVAETGPKEVYGAEHDDINLDVDRVEIFPDAEGKWYARSIDTGGNIMKTTNGSFDKDWVLKNAEDRWPGTPLYEIASPSDDSMWQERGRKGPSPKRLWG